MKKTVRRIASTCGLLALFFGSSSAHAFCTEFDILGIGVNCVDEGHKRVTGNIKPILRGSVWSAIWDGNYAQDNPLGDFQDDGQRHFESCRFVPESDRPGSIDYIRSTYQNAVTHLNPAAPTRWRRQTIRQAPAHGAGLLLPHQLDQSLEPHRIDPGELRAFVREHAGRVAAAGFASPRPRRHHPGPGLARWSPGRVVRRAGAGIGDSRFHDE